MIILRNISEKVRFYAEMPILGLERCDIFENPDDLDGMRCRANRRRKKNTRMACRGNRQNSTDTGTEQYDTIQ